MKIKLHLQYDHLSISSSPIYNGLIGSQIIKIFQSMPTAQFSFAYQFKSQRIGKAIFANIASNFILPAWLEKYYQHKENIKYGEYQTHIIDYRTLKYCQKTKQYIFLAHDKEEFDNIWEKGSAHLVHKMENVKRVDVEGQADLAHKPIAIQQRDVRVSAQGSDQNQWLKNQKKYVKAWTKSIEKLNESLRYNPQKIDYFNQRSISTILLTINDSQNYYLLFRKDTTPRQKKDDSFHSEEDYFFSVDQRKFYTVSINIQSRTYQLDKNRDLHILQEHDLENQSHSQVAMISFNAVDKDSHIIISLDNNKSEKPSKETLFLGCEVVNYSQAQNQFIFPFKEYQLRTNKIFGFQNYCLAFQGGGAKGLAYVGAYKALQQVKINHKTVPTKSIMGSSAGGITAIAASTGISYKEIQKICYKMTTIPKNDRITAESRDKPVDEYGNQMTFNIIDNKFRAFAEQFKLLNRSTIDYAIDFLNKPQFKENFIKLIKIANPSMADIFYDGTTQKKKRQGFSTVEYEETKINWAGVLLHGALMKGDAIHDIAAECLIKYFLKRSQQDGDKFISKLEDCLLEARSQKINAKQIIAYVEQYKAVNKEVLTWPLASLIKDSSAKALYPFVAFVLNQTIVVLNEHLEENTQHSLSLTNIKSFELSDAFKKKCHLVFQIIEKITKDKNKKQQCLNNLKAQIQKVQQQDLRKKLEVSCQLLQKDNSKIEQVQHNQEKIRVLERKKFKLQQLDEEIHIIQILQSAISVLKNNQKTVLLYFKKKVICQWVEQLIEVLKENSLEMKLHKLHEKLQFLLKCQTYNELNACNGQPNFIDHTHLLISEEQLASFKNKSIAALISESFATLKPRFYEECVQINHHHQQNQDKIQLKSSQLSEAIYTYYTAQQIQGKGKDHVFYDKLEQFDNFVKYVSQLTMKEYYIINPIELTCTSVDLDNKILRLFNHKTTPDLPICKAIQMTGSFPVGFKAQRWKRQWGYYYVHHQSKLTVIDITGHEFTDGGLLANFPIKYFDNQTIRQCYFSHGQESSSILLGFGLHQLEDGTYQKQSQEIKEEYKKNIQSSITKKNIKQLLSICQVVKNLLLSDIFSSSKTAEWGQFNLFILQQIPLFKFIYKLLSAYPNADRNLNIEAFSSTIMVQDMADINEVPAMESYLRTISGQENQKSKKEKELGWKIRRFYWHYEHFQSAVENGSQNAIGIEQNRKDLLRIKWNKLAALRQRQAQTEKTAIKNMKKGYHLYFTKRYQSNLYPKDKDNYDTLISEKQMSLTLIKILLVTLKTFKTNTLQATTNNQINNILSQRYAYFKYLSKNSGLKLKTTEKLSNIEEIKLELNKQNFTNLYQFYNFEEIERHFNFTDFQTNFIESLARKGISSVTQLQSKEKAKERKDIKQNMLKKLDDFEDYFFSDFNLFDISDNIRRLTQYLYFEIKGQNIADTDAKRIADMVRFVKTNQYEDLLQVDPQSQYGQLGHLTFNEIFSFLLKLKDEGANKGRKIYKIKFHWELEKYLDQTKGKESQIYDKEDLINRRHKIQSNLNFGLNFYTSNLINPSSQTDIRKQQVQQYERSLLSTKQIDQFITEYMFDKNDKNDKNRLNNYKNYMMKLLRTQKDQQCISFLQFLQHPLRLKKQQVELSIENQIQIKQLKSHILSCLKKRLFGERLENFPSFKFTQQAYQIIPNSLFVKNFTDQLKRDRKKQLQRPLQLKLQKNIFKSPNHFSFIEKELLDYFFVKSIYIQIKTKLEVKGRERSKFYLFHEIYGKDMDYILKFLREIIILMSSVQEQTWQKQRWQIVKRLYQLYEQIVETFTLNYEKLCLLADNQLNIETLSQAFLIKFQHILQLVNIAKKINKISEEYSSQITQIIKKAFFEFNGYKFSIPMFAEDWMLLFNFTTQFSSQRGVSQQNVNYEITFKVQKQISKSIAGKKRNKRILQGLLNNQKQGQQRRQQKGLHLVMEGVANSSEHFTAYYQYLQSYKMESNVISNDRDDKNFKISMITSTTIFGFLLALYGDEDVNKIRADLYKIRNYLYQMYDSEEINNIEQGLSISPNHYQHLMTDLSKQLSNSFTKFSKVYQSQGERVSYSKYFNDIRLICQSEQARYLETCREILDNSAAQIKSVEDNYLQSQRANEIAKRFAFNYQCQFNQNHEYNKINESAKTLYLKIVNQLFSQFGDLICATTCNLFAANSPLIIGKDKVQQFTKGAMISKLLSAYRLKAFIFERLQSYDLPNNITLKQFYERCTKKIILNFSVINLNEQRLDFMNMITTPKMPVWAAILASTTLPIVHRNFWCEREWEQLIETENNSSFEDKSILEFFKDRNNFKRKHTQYNSAVYISSIPMELLTNSTLNHRLAKLDPKATLQKFSNIVGLAYNPKYSTNLMHLNLKTNYLKLSFKLCEIALRFICSCTSASGTTTSKAWFFKEHQNQHSNKTYEVSYNPISSLFKLFTQSATTNVLTTLSESNDNLILDWYHSYLIRLPIKIGTLEFNSILVDKYMKKYRMQVPSHQTKDTLLRSYEITKTFVYEIQKTGQKSVEEYNQQRQNAGANRFLTKLRTQIIEIPNKNTGFAKDYLKVTFLNHSKWNQNQYSNYVIEYAIMNAINEKRLPEFTRSENSQIVWQVERSSVLLVRFYYLHKLKTSEHSFVRKIKFTQMEFNFSKVVKQLHQRNSYDYEFNYAENEDPRALFQQSITLNKEDSQPKLIKPIKVNEIALNNRDITSKFPELIVSIKGSQNSQRSIVNNRKPQEKYIERSRFRFENAK